MCNVRKVKEKMKIKKSILLTTILSLTFSLPTNAMLYQHNNEPKYTPRETRPEPRYNTHPNYYWDYIYEQEYEYQKQKTKKRRSREVVTQRTLQPWGSYWGCAQSGSNIPARPSSPQRTTAGMVRPL